MTVGALCLGAAPFGFGWPSLIRVASLILWQPLTDP
jgi:hypothetical protein